MSYRLIEKFVEGLGDHPATPITGPVSPLLMLIPWSDNPNAPLTLLVINRGRESLLAIDEYYYHLLSEEKFREYFEKRVSKKELEDTYYAYASAVQSLYDELSQIDFSREDEETLLACLKRVTAVFEEVSSTVYIETLNYEIAREVVGEKNKSVLDTIWEEATDPTFVSFEGRRLTSLVKLIRETEEISALIPKVRYIYTDYHWTKSDSDILAELRRIKDTLPEKEKEVVALWKDAEERRATYGRWSDSLTEEGRFVTEFIQMVMLFRDIRKDPIAQTQAMFIQIVTELLNRAGIDSMYGVALNVYECAGGVAYLKSIKDELVKRAEGSISIIYPDSTVEVELCDYERATEELHSLTAKMTEGPTNSIKGQVANKGKATGTVRIVTDPHHDKGFVDGDILVTSMTRPEFIPIMKRAGAVVTNEGGITCHAAIVSRELGIPCVIGTKIATRTFRDGDLVEVDADNGVVRKITV